jgi:hypothetical protein
MAMAVLAHHGVKYRVAGDWLEVWEEASTYGEDSSKWVACPRSIYKLRLWLGY